MDLKEIDQLGIENERAHWWIRTRFLYIDQAIKARLLAGSQPLSVVEYGCGSGQNLWYVTAQSPFKHLIHKAVGIDPELQHPDEFFVAERVTLSNQLDAATGIKADIVLAMDVLEHIDDEHDALRLWRDTLSDQGMLFITVPAFHHLWSYHDEFLGHKRRYTKEALIRVAREAELEATRVGFIFGPLYPLVFLARKILRGKPNQQDLTLPPRVINWLLLYIGKLESRFGGSRWFGTSIYAVCKKQVRAG